MIKTQLFRKIALSSLASTIGAIGIQTSVLADAVNRPTPNPFLASPLYAITHFDSSQSDSTPYGPPPGTFTVNPTSQPIVYGGPINIITLASTQPDYMWQVGTDRISYVYKNGEHWDTLATYQALADASNNNLPAIPDVNLRTFGESTAIGMDTTSMDSYMTSLFGTNYANRFGNGIYSLTDNNNVLYATYLNTLYGVALNNPDDPSQGITPRYRLDDVVNTIEGNNPSPGTRLSGLSMTYDGHLVITLSNGIAVIDRNLDPNSISFYQFPEGEFVTNSIAIDENEGIYVATGSNDPNTNPVSMMRKLVWTGTTISDQQSDGAWLSPYENSGTELPPIIKFGNGTGSTPTLMGFGDDSDKLVVITDGAKQMNLVAFWRDQIPDGFTERIADQIDVTAGFTSPLPEWIQSEQSVVVNGYGAFVVNNIPQTVSSNIQNTNKLVQVSLMGPAYPTSFGAERFEWDPATHKWSSIWGRSDVSSTSMVPVYSSSSNMALINGWEDNSWKVLGLDWDTGATVHQTLFGTSNFGNGAYAILQYLEDGDLLFNSISGPIRVNYSSTASTPEPNSVVALLGLGLLGVTVRKLKR